jgi:hypothetical protein
VLGFEILGVQLVHPFRKVFPSDYLKFIMLFSSEELNPSQLRCDEEKCCKEIKRKVEKEARKQAEEEEVKKKKAED